MNAQIPFPSPMPRSGWWMMRFSNALKRGCDIVASLAALILLAPLFGFIALAIRRDSPGPVIYRGKRIGLHGKTFHILKFRTMYETPESYQGPGVTAHDDPRITPLGRWLRDTKLNELPQFWNVLIGDMSLVGPRPEIPEIAMTWPPDVREEILSVRPGITSPASVLYRNEERLLFSNNVLHKYMHDLVPDKLRLDQLYVRYRSFWLDIDVLLWTLLVFLPKIRSYNPPEQLLFVGPFRRLIRRYVSWFVVDLIVTFIAIGITGLIWRVNAPLNIGWPLSIALAAGFAFLFSATGAILGMNHISWSQANASDVFDLLPAWALAAAVAFFLNRIFHLFPSTMVVTASMLALCGYVFIRYRSRLITGLLSRFMQSRGAAMAGRERVLIVGGGATAQYIAWLLENMKNSSKYWVVGFVHDDFLAQGMRIYGAKVVGTFEDIPNLIRKYDVGLLLIANHRLSLKEYQYIARVCDAAPVRLAVVPDILATLNGLGKELAGDGKKPSEPNGSERPCDRCLAGYAPLKMQAKLDELRGAMQAGDLETVQSCVESLRENNHTGEKK